jgi:peptidoglycan/LPS O-acetylase OafA/YrhL
MPFLWVGWTLFYEMAFYAVFGLFLGLGRGRGIAATAAVLSGLVLAGSAVPPDNAFLFALTRPVLLMFLAGMVLALWRTGGRRAPGWMRLAALTAVIPAMTLIAPPAEGAAMGFDYLAWCGLPALLLALAVLGGELTLPAPRAVLAAGDMSYALYLLHVPIAWFWLWFWARLPFFDAGPWDYLVSGLAATFALSWLFFAQVERPLTAALNRRVRSPHEHEV